MYKEACDKLRREMGAAKLDQKANVMKKAVVEALENFCKQSGEFCKRVIEGGSFEECMKAVSKGVGNSISDLEAYRRAVKYYWQDADIRFVMEINAGGKDAPAIEHKEAVPKAEPAKQPVMLDLMDFL